MAKSHVMSTPLPRMNTLFVGCAPRLPGSLNAMKGTNQLSLPASLSFSAALSLYLRLLNLSRLDTAMMKKQSNSCVPSFATTKWSCAFLGSCTPFMLCRLNRHWPVSLTPPAPAAPHIALLPEGFELDPPATSQLHQPASPIPEKLVSCDASVYRCNTCLGPQATILGGAVFTLVLRNQSAVERSSLMTNGPRPRGNCKTEFSR